MKLPMSLSEPRIRDMSIDLGRRDGGMSEELLDDPDIRSIRQEGRSEGVSEGVSGDILQDPSLRRIVSYHTSDKKSRESHRVICETLIFYIVDREIVSEKKWGEVVFSDGEIELDFFFCCWGEVDGTEFVSLSSDSELHRIERDRDTIETRELGDTKSCRVDTLHDSEISDTLDRICWYDGEKSLDLFTSEKCHLSITHLQEIESRRIEALDSFFLQVFQPWSDRDDMSIHSLRRESAIGELESPAIEVLLRDMIDLDRGMSREIC